MDKVDSFHPFTKFLSDSMDTENQMIDWSRVISSWNAGQLPHWILLFSCIVISHFFRFDLIDHTSGCLAIFLGRNNDSCTTLQLAHLDIFVLIPGQRGLYVSSFGLNESPSQLYSTEMNASGERLVHACRHFPIDIVRKEPCGGCSGVEDV